MACLKAFSTQDHDFYESRIFPKIVLIIVPMHQMIYGDPRILSDVSGQRCF